MEDIIWVIVYSLEIWSPVWEELNLRCCIFHLPVSRWQKEIKIWVWTRPSALETSVRFLSCMWEKELRWVLLRSPKRPWRCYRRNSWNHKEQMAAFAASSWWENHKSKQKWRIISRTLLWKSRENVKWAIWASHIIRSSHKCHLLRKVLCKSPLKRYISNTPYSSLFIVLHSSYKTWSTMLCSRRTHKAALFRMWIHWGKGFQSDTQLALLYLWINDIR